jgi:predicted site-specific integrase-resolvase
MLSSESVMKTYSTKETARLTGVHYITLQRWVSQGKVRPSQKIRQDGFTLWRWTEWDLKRVRKYKQENYRKGRGRKPKH